ncbi:15477_t:CDS:2, partial [Cetraspora pellucida]
VDPECKIRTFPDLNNGEKEHIWVTHDETTFYVYDGPHSMWGPLKDKQEEACVMMVLDANRDGYWDSKKLLEQVVRAVNIFERTHPECVGVFVFDNATSHKAFAEDALVASKMNFGPGGSVPKMQDTMWSGGHQSMIIEEDYFLWKDGMVLECISCKKKEADPNVIDCCARQLISNQTDFLEQCDQIQQEIESRRHKVLFYPKFHPEFNHIKMYWEMAKRYTQSHCEYSLSKTRETICEAFDSIS